MVAKSLRWALAGWMLFPTAALALGLGDVHLKSALDAPLDASIEILGATPAQMANLKPQIASRKVFAQHGIDWSPFLTHVTIRAVHLADGRNVLEVRSRQPVTEPFLSMLIELKWTRGEFLREYDLLFNPPVFTPHSSQAARTIAAPVTGPGVRAGAIKRSTETAPPTVSQSPSKTVTSPPAPSAKAPSAATASAAAPRTYSVRRGDTLFGIAGNVASGSLAERERWMLATYRANPAAFDHNMNWLRAGTVLRLPSASAVDAITAGQAQGAVHRQYVAWRGEVGVAQRPAQKAGRLRLIAPTRSGAGSTAEASGPGSQVAKSLRAQVQSLQSQLASSRRLLALKSAQLQKLQAQLAAREGEAAATGSSAPAKVSAATVPPAAAAVATPPAKKPAVAVRRPPVRRPTAASQAKKLAASPSFLGEVRRFWWAIALLLAALLGYVGLSILGSRRKSALEESLDGFAQVAGAHREEPTQVSEPALKVSREPAHANERPGVIVVEESGTHERPQLDVAAVPAAAHHVETDDTVSGETAIKLDQGDPLAEADFHMAYGLYDQAADLIRIAAEREPQRRDLKLKLLEVFFVWGNTEQFLQTARDLAATRAEAGPGEWDKIVIMGKQLAPEDPLFASGTGVSGAASVGVDLDLEGGQHQVDFDVAGSEEPAVEGLDLDIGKALGERDGVAEAAAHQATDRNLALDDSLVMADDATAERPFATPTQRMTGMADESTNATREMTGTTREMEARASEMSGVTREMTTTLEQDSWDPTELTPDAPTVERPALQPSDAEPARLKVESALKASGTEHTAEVAVDDLGLDFDPLGEAAQPSDSAADAPTMVAGLDEHSRRVMETAERRAVEAEDGLKISATGTWHFDEDPYVGKEEEAGNPSSGRGDLTDTSRLAALRGGKVDFELGEPTQIAPTQTVALSGNGSTNPQNGGLDLDVGNPREPEGSFAATQRLADDEIALPDLEPVTMSEVGTKLDLARAYMDMGDPEGARNILEEVLGEGSVVQKQEAERLIASLPG